MAVSELDTTATEQRARSRVAGRVKQPAAARASTLRDLHMNSVTKPARAVERRAELRAHASSAKLQGVIAGGGIVRGDEFAATPYVSLFTAAQASADFLTQLTAAGTRYAPRSTRGHRTRCSAWAPRRRWRRSWTVAETRWQRWTPRCRGCWWGRTGCWPSGRRPSAWRSNRVCREQRTGGGGAGDRYCTRWYDSACCRSGGG